MGEEIISVLRSFGWTEGFHVPVANDENKLLEIKLDEATKKKQQSETLLQDLNHNFENVKSYYGNIIEQRIENEQMLVDYRKQLEDENQSFDGLHYEKESLIRDSKLLNKNTIQLQDDNKRLQTEIQAIVEQYENLKQDIDWSEEMDRVLDENINDQSAMLTFLERYIVYDKISFEQTEQERQKLYSEYNEYQLLLNQKDMDISTSELELNKLAKSVENIQKEREWLLEQWETAVRVLHVRDKEIENIIKEMRIRSEVSRNTESEMLEQRNFSKVLKRNNMEMEITHRQILRDTSNQHQINDKFSNMLQVKSNELVERQNELNSMGALISEEQTLNTQLKRQINMKNELVELLKQDYENLHKTLDNLESRAVSSVDRIAQLERIFQEEKKQYSCIVQERRKMDRTLQNLRCKLSDLEANRIHLQSQIKQMNTVRSKLQTNIALLEEELDEQTNSLNSIESQIEEISSKIEYLKQGKSNELKLELDEKLSKLTNEFNEKKMALDTLRMEVNKCNNEIKTFNKEIGQFTENMKNLRDEKELLNFRIESDEKHLVKFTEENKEKEVTENLLRLRAKELEKAVNKTGAVVFSLEKQQIEIKTLLKEKLLEIEASCNLLKIRKKALLAEISTLKRTVDQVNVHITQLMKKYEIILDNVGRDEKGEPITITNYKIQLVKERYSLLEKGDDLDEKIRKAESEIQAMENTLLLMNTCNKTYKNSISPIDQDSKEFKKKEALEQEYNCLLTTYKKHRKVIPELQSDIEAMKIKASELKNQLQHLESLNREKEQEMSRLEHEVNQQYNKLSRVENRISVLKKSLMASQNVDLLERDHLAKELQIINKTVRSEISKLAYVYSKIEPLLSQYLSEKCIALQRKNMTKKSRDVTPSEFSSKISTETGDNLYIDSSTTPSARIVNLNATSIFK